MKHFNTSFILLVAIACMMITTLSCSKDDESSSSSDCISVLIDIVEDGLANAIAINSIQFYNVSFNINDISMKELQKGDIIDIHIIEYEIPDRFYPMHTAPPIICTKVELCK